jgi:sialic acid synthase SpsE
MMFSDSIFVIAEVGVNHNGDTDLAKELCTRAKECGASAVKFQHFHTDEIISKRAKLAKYQERSKYKTQYDMVKSYELSDAQILDIVEHCKLIGVKFIATPFSQKALRFLVNEVKMDLIKVGSGEIINLPLLREIGKTGHPVILSTGMAKDIEIELAISTLVFSYISTLHNMHHNDVLKHIEEYKSSIVILHCTTAYPCPPNEACLDEITRYSKIFSEHKIGFSDHTEGRLAACCASFSGATIFEKHITMDINLEGPDHAASCPIDKFSDYIDAIMLGDLYSAGEKNALTTTERSNMKVARRSYHQSKDETERSFKRPYDGVSAYIEK